MALHTTVPACSSGQRLWLRMQHTPRITPHVEETTPFGAIDATGFADPAVVLDDTWPCYGGLACRAVPFELVLWSRLMRRVGLPVALHLHVRLAHSWPTVPNRNQHQWVRHTVAFNISYLGVIVIVGSSDYECEGGWMYA